MTDEQPIYKMNEDKEGHWEIEDLRVDARKRRFAASIKFKGGRVGQYRGTFKFKRGAQLMIHIDGGVTWTGEPTDDFKKSFPGLKVGKEIMRGIKECLDAKKKTKAH